MRVRELTLSERGFVLIAIPLIFEIVLAIGLRGLLDASEHERARETRSKQILAAHDAMFRDMYELIRDAKVYVVSHDHALLSKFNQHVADVDADVAALKASVADDAQESALVQEVERKKNEFRVKIVEMKDLLEAGHSLQAMQIFDDNREYARSLLPLLHDNSLSLIDREKAIEYQSPVIQSKFRDQIVALLNAGLFGNVAVAILLAVYFNRKTGARLRILMDNIRRVVERKPLNPPIQGSDEIAQLDKVFNDMARALEIAAKKERALIENVADVICTIDEDLVFEAVSPSCITVFGQHAEQLVGRPVLQFVGASDGEKLHKSFAENQSGVGRNTVESAFRTADGGTVEVMWSVQWLESDRRYYCVAHNITERKQIERLKQEFVAMVSHDLRTPLTTIQLFHSMLGSGLYGELNASGKETLSSADGNVGRLMTLVNNLLDVDKLESGQMSVDLGSTDIGDVLRQTTDAVAGYAEAYKVKLEVQNSADELIADEHRLVQVMVNLASNAVKFSQPGHSVTLAAFEKGDYIRFEVRDTGRGIPAHLKEQVFERFKQVESADAKKKGGTGLGLAICKNIVELHNGKIGVESEEGKGSTFWFEIPICPLTTSADAVIQSRKVFERVRSK